MLFLEYDRKLYAIVAGSTEVSVQITPVNEDPPVFNPASYSQTISESTAYGTTIETIVATDADSGTDGVFDYSIQSVTPISGGSLFGIDPASGKISLIGTLDVETQTTYTLNVRATDRGVTPNALSADTTVTISVQDANDNTPICNPAVYSKELAEDSSGGMDIFF